MTTSSGCGGVVVFNYTLWITSFPEFAAVTQPRAQSFFDRVTTGGFVDNTTLSPIQNLAERTILLNLATCHIAVLSGALSPAQAQTVGRVSSATQGSVSVNLDFTPKGGALAQWWNQTQYGAQFYAATLRYRTATYFPPPAAISTLPYFNRFGLGIRRR